MLLSAQYTFLYRGSTDRRRANGKDEGRDAKQLLVVAVLAAGAGIFGALTFFFEIGFMRMQYSDSWDMYQIFMHDTDRSF